MFFYFILHAQTLIKIKLTLPTLRQWQHSFTAFIFKYNHCSFLKTWLKKEIRFLFLCSNNRWSNKYYVWAGLYDEIFYSRPWNFYFERKVSKYFRKRNVYREKLLRLFTQSSFIHTIMIAFHSMSELTIFIFLVTGKF